MSHRSVHVADWAVGKGQGIISTVGLGSCIAIMLHDRATRVGGMAHVLLPDVALARDRSNRAKFPSTAVPLLCEEMIKQGAGPRQGWRAHLVGGASMFGQLAPAGTITVGERNVAASREALRAAGLALAAEDVGGEHGRSVHFHLADGRIEVRSLRTGTRVL